MRRWLAVAAAAAAIALLALMLAGSGLIPSTQPRRVILFTVSAEGAGVIYVNGTPVGGSLTLNSTEPFTLVLEAKPCECHRLAGWLVNGSLVGSGNLTLAVAGNTTVVARFERLRYPILVSANLSGAPVMVNGSLVELPYVAEACCGCRLLLNALRTSNGTHSLVPVGFLVNGALVRRLGLELRVEGPLNVTALYRAETHVLELRCNAPNATLLLNGAEVRPPLRLMRPYPFTVNITAPELVRVNDTFAWGFPVVEVWNGYRWVRVGNESALVEVEDYAKVRVRYTPVYFMTVPSNKGPTQLMVIYRGSLYGKNKWRIQGNQIVVEGYDDYSYALILPEDWSKLRIRIDGCITSIGFAMRFDRIGSIFMNKYVTFYSYRGDNRMKAIIEFLRKPLRIYLKDLESEDLKDLDYNMGEGRVLTRLEPEIWELMLDRGLGLSLEIPSLKKLYLTFEMVRG